MANYQFSSDLVADILFRAGEQTDGTSDFAAVALQYLNRAYQALLMGGSEVDPEINEDWWWARKHPPGVINLSPAYDTGTVSATNDNVTLTLSAAPAYSLAGYFFRANGHPDIFRVSAHTAASTSVTLDAAYTGPTDAALTFKFFKAEYDLASDMVRVIAPMRVYQGAYTEVDGTELMSLERDWPLNLIESGPPTQFAFVTETKVRFNTYGPLTSASVPNSIRLEYDYVYRPADLTNSGSEEPIVPWQYRKLLADIAVTLLFVDKNDDRAAAVSQLAKKGLQAMEKEQRSRMINYSRSNGLISPRLNQESRLRRPLRTDSGFIIG